MTQFNIANFETVSLVRRGEAEMHLNKRYMTFTKSLLEDMDCPSYVRILINAKGGELALQACKSSDENAYKFSRPKGIQKDAKYCCTASIKDAVIAAMGSDWDETKFYGFSGTYFPDDKAMVFTLGSFYVRDVEPFRRNRT